MMKEVGGGSCNEEQYLMMEYKDDENLGIDFLGKLWQ